MGEKYQIQKDFDKFCALKEMLEIFSVQLQSLMLMRGPYSSQKKTHT